MLHVCFLFKVTRIFLINKKGSDNSRYSRYFIIVATINIKRAMEILFRIQGVPSALSNMLNCSSKKDCPKFPRLNKRDKDPFSMGGGYLLSAMGFLKNC